MFWFILWHGGGNININMEKVKSQGLAQYMGLRIRNLAPQLRTFYGQANPTAVMQVVVTYLLELCQQKKKRAITQVLKSVSGAYVSGDTFVRESINYLFMYSFERLGHRCSPRQWQGIIAALPMGLKEIYCKHNLH